MYNFDTMEHADITLPKPDVHATHPFRDQASHDRLLRYLQARLLRSKKVRDVKLNRLIQIDRDVNAWMKLSDDDRERVLTEMRTGVPQQTMIHLPLTFIHLDDMMTYLVQTFAPSRGMFYQSGKPDENVTAQQIVTLMNNHAIHGGYFREVAKVCYSILKYRQAGIYAFWAKDYGPQITIGQNGLKEASETIVWQGNRIEALDEYNTLNDPGVSAIDLHRDGEFCARAMMKTHYWVQARAARGIYFNVEDLLSADNGEGTRATFYINPPTRAQMETPSLGGTDGSNGTDWFAVLSETESQWQGNGFEIVEVFCKVNPVQLNLIPKSAANKSRNTYEIWRFSICNNERIIEATYMNNVHGHLPYYYGTTKDDSLGSANKSVAEIIQPLAKFGSFLLNSHIAQWRKDTYGLTFYDPTAFDFDELPAGETAGRIPMKAAAQGRDIREIIWKDQSSPSRDGTMEDLQSVMGIINQFFPTSAMPSQIASIDRAIDSQVAAVQQGTNRRNQKDARMIDDTLFRPFRFACYYNIVQYQADNVEVQDFYGKTIQIDLSALKQTDMPYIVGQGLKSIDIQASAARLQQIIFALIQNPQTAAGINLLALIDYWTSLIDIDVDMTKFHVQQQPGVGPDGQPIPGAAVTPITNPAAVTAPLTKPGVDHPAG